MKLVKQPSEVSITFSPKDYFLCKGNDEHPYALCYKIDMSYKGKADQQGTNVFYMNEKQAQIFIDAGFVEVI